MHKSVREILDSAEFRHLVATRWRVSLTLTGLLFVLYYGYIILIATNPQLIAAFHALCPRRAMRAGSRSAPRRR